MSFITAHSFIFNKTNSADFGVTIGWIDSKADVSTNGLTRELKKTARTTKTKSYIYSAENTEPISFHFSIVKADGSELTRAESIKINRWLTSSPLPQLLKFNDCDTYPLHYYAVCTQINDITSGGQLIGKELTFETNSSFAFSGKEKKTFMITETDNCFFLNNSADTDNGIYYPTVTISTKSDKVVMENVTDQKSVTINMQTIKADANGNKVIALNSENMTVTDNSGQLIPADQLGWNEAYTSYVSSIDDFMDNIYWPRLLQGMNEWNVSGACTLTIEYEFPRKAGCL